MQSAFDYAVEYVHDRKQFGQPVGTFQLMQGLYISELSDNGYLSFPSQGRRYVYEVECK